MRSQHQSIARSRSARRGRWVVPALLGQAIVLVLVATAVAELPAGAAAAAATLTMSFVSVFVATTQIRRSARAADRMRDERTRILHQIAAGEPLNATLEAIASFAARRTNAACAILMRDSGGEASTLRPLATHGIDPNDAVRYGLPCQAAIAGMTFETTGPLREGRPDIATPCAALGLCDGRGEPVGCIAIYGPAAGEPSVGVSEVLATAADLIAIAVVRTRTDAATQSLIDDLAARNGELERLHAEAEQAKARAESAASVKGEFLANMSHELRTPMTAILGFADVLDHNGLSDSERAEHVESIRRAGEHLLTLINDVLDLSKIEAGKMAIEETDVSPIQIMSDAIGMLRGRARAKNIALVTRCDGAIPVRIRSDPTRLRQILINLVGNAVKFTERGEVCVRIGMATAPTDPNPKLMLEVIDTGIGIAADALPRLFRPFSQADGSMSRRYGGTGLGLAICRRLSEMLGGGISVESEPGKGSSFRVTIATGPITDVPMVSGLDAIAARRGADDGHGATGVLRGRILVADDSVDNQRLIAFHLKRAGADVDIAVNGREAVRRALESQGDRRGPYQLILMDMQMPELDGYQATAALRNRGWSGPIVALTANGAEHGRERCLAAGCDDYQAKPAQRDDLVETCRRWLERRGALRSKAA